MKRLALILLASLLLIGPSQAQMNLLTGAGGKFHVTAGGVSLSLDGTPQVANSGSTNALALPAFTSPSTNDIICLAIESNSTLVGGHAVSSVTGGGLTFASEPGLTPPSGGGSTLELWTAVSASAQSGTVFTVNTNSSAFITVVVFAVHGAKTSAPFDAGGPTVSNTNTYATVTTTTANTFSIAVAVAGTQIAAPANGYTNMSATATSNFLNVEYKIASATQTGVVFDTTNSGVSFTTALVIGP